jgi:hypothetical protein
MFSGRIRTEILVLLWFEEEKEPTVPVLELHRSTSPAAARFLPFESAGIELRLLNNEEHLVHLRLENHAFLNFASYRVFALAVQYLAVAGSLFAVGCSFLWETRVMPRTTLTVSTTTREIY